MCWTPNVDPFLYSKSLLLKLVFSRFCSCERVFFSRKTWPVLCAKIAWLWEAFRKKTWGSPKSHVLSSFQWNGNPMRVLQHQTHPSSWPSSIIVRITIIVVILMISIINILVIIISNSKDNHHSHHNHWLHHFVGKNGKKSLVGHANNLFVYLLLFWWESNMSCPAILLKWHLFFSMSRHTSALGLPFPVRWGRAAVSITLVPLEIEKAKIQQFIIILHI